MIKLMTGLASSRLGEVRKVAVRVTGDANRTITDLSFVVCDRHYEQRVTLEPNETRVVEVEHGESGRCYVIVKDESTNRVTTKYLDLDVPSCF